MAVLGLDVTTIQDVVLTPSQRARGTYVLGATGTGKSRLLESMIVQDLKAGHGVCVLDPHGPLPGALINRVIPQIPPERLGEVVLLDLTDTGYPFPFNLFNVPDRDDPDGIPRVVSMVMGLYERLWGPDSRVPAWGARMAQTMRNSFYVLSSNEGKTLVSLPRLLRDEGYCRHLLGNTRNPQTQAFFDDYWKGTRHHRDELSDSTLNKVDEFLANPIVCNLVGQPDSVPIHSVVEHGLILLVKLDPQLRDITSLVGGAILSRILHVVLGRGSPRPFCLYADEFQRFATKDFATLMTEARKANVWLTVAHQHRGQPGLDGEMLGATLNAATKVFFRLVGDDAQGLVTGIPLPELYQDEWEQEIIPDREQIKVEVWDTQENLDECNRLWEELNAFQEPVLAFLRTVFSSDTVVESRKHQGGLENLLAWLKCLEETYTGPGKKYDVQRQQDQRRRFEREIERKRLLGEPLLAETIEGIIAIASPEACRLQKAWRELNDQCSSIYKNHRRVEKRWVTKPTGTALRIGNETGRGGTTSYRMVKKPVPQNEVRGRVMQQLVTLPLQRAYVAMDDRAMTIATIVTPEELGEDMVLPMLRDRARDVVARPRKVVEEMVRREWGIGGEGTLPPRKSLT